MDIWTRGANRLQERIDHRYIRKDPSTKKVRHQPNITIDAKDSKSRGLEKHLYQKETWLSIIIKDIGKELKAKQQRKRELNIDSGKLPDRKRQLNGIWQLNPEPSAKQRKEYNQCDPGSDQHSIP